MTVLGFWITILAFITSLVAMLNYYRNATGRRYILAPARTCLKVSVASIFAASLLLFLLIIRHDFSNGYVYSYSDKSLPLYYLFSAFYAGQEGSFLFWVLCSALIALWLSPFAARRKSEPFVMGVFMAVQSLLILLLIAKSPFKYVWEMLPSFPAQQIPADGRGLNPLLQNFWMVIHPPVLFVGFAAMAVPFSFAIAGLWKRDFSGWVAQAFPWVLFASCSLGMGLMLGAYWAYGVLGWGGYWGWDPVENSSLVPWITSVALLHTLLAQRRSQKYVRTNFALAIVSFFLVVYSTFLTRSGILGDSSVHSFTDPGATVYSLLIVFLAFIAVLGFGLMAARWKELKSLSSDAEFVSRETALGAGTIALLLSAGVVLFGTSLPIFSKTSVEPSFYDATNLPIAIAIGLLIGFSLFIQWKTDEWKEVVKRAWRSVAASVVLTAMLGIAGVTDVVVLVFIFSSAFAFFTNLELVLRTRNGGVRALGGKLAHLGIAVMFLGIIATGKFSRTEHLSLALNIPQQAFGYTLTYTGNSSLPDGKFAFNVMGEKDGNKFALAPVMFEAAEQGLMRNPDIASFLTRDLYLSPVSLDQGENHAAHADAETYTLTKGQAVSMGSVKATFVKFDMDAHATDAMSGEQQGMAIGSVLKLSDGKNSETITPIAHYGADGSPTFTPSNSKLMGGSVQLVSMDVGTGEGISTVTVNVHRHHEAAQQTSETLIVEASIKPYIGLLWSGTVLMIIGFIFAIIKRSTEA